MFMATEHTAVSPAVPASPRRGLRRLVRGQHLVAFLAGLRTTLAHPLPAHRPPHFGWHEAVTYGGKIDRWERYTAVLEAIEAHCDTGRALRILDVGAGGPGILAWRRHAPWLPGSRVYLLDIGRAHLSGRQGPRIIGTGLALPLADKSFDVAVSVASLEHLPVASRPAYVDELRRVAGLVVIYVPAQSENGEYRGRDADAAFQRWFTARFGHPEENTVEHLRAEAHPNPDTLIPGATVLPCQSVLAWLDVMQDDFSPWRQNVAGLRYYRRHRGRRAQPEPPYYSAILVAPGRS